MDAEKLQELQKIEQNLQMYGLQKQTVQSQLLEAENALQELGKSDEAHRIVGNIMVKVKKTELEKELAEKVQTLRSRAEKIGKQEARVQKEAQELQQELMKGMDKEK